MTNDIHKRSHLKVHSCFLHDSLRSGMVWCPPRTVGESTFPRWTTAQQLSMAQVRLMHIHEGNKSADTRAQLMRFPSPEYSAY